MSRANSLCIFHIYMSTIAQEQLNHLKISKYFYITYVQIHKLIVEQMIITSCLKLVRQDAVCKGVDSRALVAFSLAPHSTSNLATGRDGKRLPIWPPSSKKFWVFRELDFETARCKRESPCVVRGSIRWTNRWIFFLRGSSVTGLRDNCVIRWSRWLMIFRTYL